MIVRENYGDKFIRAYSDEGYYIRKIGTNEIYVNAIDLKTSSYEYEETSELIEVNE